MVAVTLSPCRQPAAAGAQVGGGAPKSPACSLTAQVGSAAPKSHITQCVLLQHSGDTGHLAFPGALLHDCFPGQSGPPAEHGQGASTPCSWPHSLCRAALHPCHACCEPGQSPWHGASPHLLPAPCTATHTGSVTLTAHPPHPALPEPAAHRELLPHHSPGSAALGSVIPAQPWGQTEPGRNSMGAPQLCDPRMAMGAPQSPGLCDPCTAMGAEPGWSSMGAPQSPECPVCSRVCLGVRGTPCA